MSTAPARLSKKQRLEIIERWNKGETDIVQELGYQVTTTKTGKTQVKRIFTPEQKAQRKEERKNQPPPPPEPEEDDWEPSEYPPAPKPQPPQPLKQKMLQNPKPIKGQADANKGKKMSFDQYVTNSLEQMTKDQKMIKSLQAMAGKKMDINEYTTVMVEEKKKDKKGKKHDYTIENDHEDIYLKPPGEKPNIL